MSSLSADEQICVILTATKLLNSFDSWAETFGTLLTDPMLIIITP